jgi:flagellar basal-body rod modification protein FlgD
MVTQMQHQDPTQPFKAEQFAQELAQYASVEQLQNMNTNMGKMLNANQPLERLAMTNMIGKTVTVDRERFVHTEGQPQSLNFNLPKAAKEVKVAVMNEMGEIVVEKDMGELKAGENTFAWDGIRGNTLPAKTGNYVLRIAALDEKGAPIQTNPQATATVIGVGFEGTEPALLVGNPANPDKILMRSVVRVQDTGLAQQPKAPALGSQMIPGLPGSPAAPAQQGASAPTAAQAAAPAAAPATPSLITFQKGVGSATANAGVLDPRVRAALERAQGSLEGVGLATNEAGSSEGFPNGLNEETGGESE